MRLTQESSETCTRPLDAFFQFHKGTVRNEFGDLSAHFAVDRVARSDVFPGVALHLLEPQ